MVAGHLRYVKSEVPEGRSGNWSVGHFIVHPPDRLGPNEPEWARRRPGEYTVLKRGKEIFMTDLYEEWWTQKEAIEQACRRGRHVLITGLGLGVVVESMLETPGSKLEGVTIIEASSDVIRLSGPHLRGKWADRLNIVHANAFEWLPPEGTRYTVAWHDIWPNPDDVSIIPEMDRLEQHFAPYCDWQDCWHRKRAESHLPRENPQQHSAVSNDELESSH